jgi:hypothetical protein
MAERFAPVHDRLVLRLAPSAGVTWLDVATGTGAVALRAALAGATVTGLDIAPGLLEVAEAKAGDLPVRFEVGDAEALPYEDGSFEVVSSSFGAIFAPDHSAVAAELARVCRGRLGLTTWVPSPELAGLLSRFDIEPPEGHARFEWGKREYVEGLLGDAFDLEIEEGTWILEGADGEELWELWSQAAPPFKVMVESLEEARRDEFHRAYVEYCEGYRDGDRVAVPRPYLFVFGERR